MSDNRNSSQVKDAEKKDSPELKDEKVKEAFKQAEKDIEKDPEFQPDEDADLDEGELAKKEGHP